MNTMSFSKGLATAFVAAVLLSAVLISGCTGNGSQEAAPAEMQTLGVSGSTTVTPIAELAAEEYMKTHENVDITINPTGSGPGIAAVGEGTDDIGMASRDLKAAESEKYPDLVRHVVARDGIAVIAYKDNPTDSLTIAQVKSIYKGEVTNWKDVGGEDMTIVVVGRDSSSGTREYFLDAVMDKEDFVAGQLEKNSNGAVKQTIEQTPGAIGYVGLGYVDETISAIKIDVDGTKVEPTVANVVAGTYPVSRNLNMFTKGEATGVAADYIAFILSPEGQAIVAEEGFVPL